MLTAEGIYDKDSIDSFLSITPTTQEDSSRKIFLNAMDEFKNRNNILGAVEFLLLSLRIYPSAASYYELGNVLLEQKKYKQALEAFELAAELNYKPYGNLLFQQACCYAELENDNEVYNYISYAVENGFVNKERIFNDKHIKNYKEDPQLLSAYLEAMSGNGNPEEIIWNSYLKGYKKGQFPFTIDSSTFSKVDRKYISYDFEKYIPEMRDEQFTRDVGNEYYYLVRFTGNSKYKILVYACQSYENDGAPVYYVLSTFDNKGMIIDKKIIAGAETFDEEYKEAVIKSFHDIQINAYKNSYKLDPKEEGYGDNPVVSRELIKSYVLKIGQDGKISEALIAYNSNKSF